MSKMQKELLTYKEALTKYGNYEISTLEATFEKNNCYHEGFRLSMGWNMFWDTLDRVGTLCTLLMAETKLDTLKAKVLCKKTFYHLEKDIKAIDAKMKVRAYAPYEEYYAECRNMLEMFAQFTVEIKSIAADVM